MVLGLRCVIPPPRRHTRELDSSQGVGMDPDGCMAPWGTLASGASVAEELLEPGLVVLLAGSERPAALDGVAVIAGQCSDCLM